MEASWAETVDVSVGRRVRWDLGVRRLWAQREPGQWLVGHADGSLDEEVIAFERTSVPGYDADPGDGEARVRVARAGSEGRLTLAPRPPPRAVLARAELPLSVPPGEETRVYVGIPVWAELSDRGVVLDDLPVVDLSDTWFGGFTEGTLCYATRTSLRLDLSAIPVRPYRAVVAIDVRNDADDVLLLDRVRIPTPSLDIWRDETRRRLWTSSIRMSRRREGDAEVHVQGRAPREAGKAERVGLSREPLSAPLLSRVFSAMGLGGQP